MRRRDFISLLTGEAIASPRVAMAQTSSKVFRLGTLTPGAPLDEKTPLGTILLKRLEQKGYTLGKNLTFDARGAAGQVDKLLIPLRDNRAAEEKILFANHPLLPWPHCPFLCSVNPSRGNHGRRFEGTTKANLQGNRSLSTKNRQIRLLRSTHFAKPYNDFGILHGRPVG